MHGEDWRDIQIVVPLLIDLFRYTALIVTYFVLLFWLCFLVLASTRRGRVMYVGGALLMRQEGRAASSVL